MRPSPLVPVLLLGALVAACSSNGSAASPGTSAGRTVIPVPVSSELAVGENRFVFSFLEASGNRPAATPDRTASVAFGGPHGESVDADPATFVWAIEDQRGVYVTHVTFPSAGAWQARFTTSAPGAPSETIRFDIDVRADRAVLGIGEQAPSVDTPTAADVDGDLTLLSTDPDPDPAFYQTSVADALAAGKPFVLVFATPKFCRTAQCGPTLDRLKPVAAAHPNVTFINVEPYELELTDGQLQPVITNNDLTPVPAVAAFGLISEPYVFVVDASGRISASFEAIFSDAEIDAALAALG
jgi:hypothetical protein